MVLRRTHLFSVADYEQMIETGILNENDRVELIRGEIVHKMTVGPGHAACVNALNRIFGILLGLRAIVSIQNPVRLAQSVPEPDVALLVPRADQYRKSLPTDADVLLVVEVADSSLTIDRTEKMLDYAEAGIGEYWIANLIDNVLEIYRQPHPDGTYRGPLIARPGENVTPAAFPDVVIAVADILG